MGNTPTKAENTSDSTEERSEQSQELHELQPGLSQNAQRNTVHTVSLKSALKKKKEWFMVRDDPVEKKEVRFNLADLEMRDEDPMSPPAQGYGVKFLETQVWPGRDVDQAEVAEAPVLPDAANSPETANSESKD